MSKITFLIQLFFSLNFSVVCQSQNITQKIEKFAEDIKYIDLQNFIYNRTVDLNAQLLKVSSSGPNTYTDGDSLKSFYEFRIWADSISMDDFEKYINSINPKVRTLSLLGIYHKDSLSSIYLFNQLLNDTAMTFKQKPFLRWDPGGDFHDERRHLERGSLEEKLYYENFYSKANTLTVGDVARKLLWNYFRFSGYRNFDCDLEVYLLENKGFQYTTAFINLLKSKAVGRGSPTTKDREVLVEKFKKYLAGIENDFLRNFYTIYLSAHKERNPIYDENEMIEALKSIDKNQLLGVLNRSPIINDPDLKNIIKKSDFKYSQFNRWVLLHAEYVLDKNDVKFLLNRSDTLKNSWLSHYRYIASARLDPDNAKIYLLDGIECYNGKYRKNQYFERAELYAELLKVGDAQTDKYVIDWFYDSCSKDNFGDERLEMFIQYINNPNHLKKLILDKRFYKKIPIFCAQRLVSRINILEGKKIFDYQVARVWYPNKIIKMYLKRKKLKNALVRYAKTK